MNISKKINLLVCLCLAIAGKAYGAAAVYSKEIQKLLDQKVDLNSRQKGSGNTALMRATKTYVVANPDDNDTGLQKRYDTYNNELFILQKAGKAIDPLGWSII